VTFGSRQNRLKILNRQLSKCALFDSEFQQTFLGQRHSPIRPVNGVDAIDIGNQMLENHLVAVATHVTCVLDDWNNLARIDGGIGPQH